MRTTCTAILSKLTAVTAAGLLALAQAPASATLLDVNYHGTVDTYTPGGMPQGVTMGDIAFVHLRYDTDSLIDITAAVNTAYHTDYAQVLATRLDGPGASLSVGIAGYSFTQSDHAPYADNPAIGMTGPFAFELNGSFGGISYFGLNVAGHAFVTKGLAPELFDFVGGAFAAPGPSYAGSFDPASLSITAVPEPASALMILVGLAALCVRRLRAAA